MSGLTDFNDLHKTKGKAAVTPTNADATPFTFGDAEVPRQTRQTKDNPLMVVCKALAESIDADLRRSSGAKTVTVCDAAGSMLPPFAPRPRGTVCGAGSRATGKMPPVPSGAPAMREMLCRYGCRGAWGCISCGRAGSRCCAGSGFAPFRAFSVPVRLMRPEL